MTNNTYSLPEDAQTQSRLVCLPPEIKLLILRLFLKFPKCGREDQTSVRAIRQRIRHGLTTMQTCQALRKQGSEVLFQENTVHFEMSGRVSNSRSRFDRLRLTASIFGFQDYLPHSDSTLASHLGEAYQHGAIITPLVDITNEYRSAKWVTPERARSIWQTLTKFKRFQVTIYLEPDYFSTDLVMKEGCRAICNLSERPLFYLARAYKSILTGKNMKIIPPGASSCNAFENHPNTLDGCKILRGVSIEFGEVSMPPQLKQDLQSQVPIHDTYKQFVLSGASRFKFLCVIDEPHLSNAYDLFSERYPAEIEKLKLTAMRYNTQAYLVELRVVLNLATKWHDARIKNLINSILSKMEASRKGFDRIYKDLKQDEMTTLDLRHPYDSLAEAATHFENIDSSDNRLQGPEYEYDDEYGDEFDSEEEYSDQDNGSESEYEVEADG